MEDVRENRIEGTVAALVFQNRENGYAILRLDTGTELFTVVGTLPAVSCGELLAVEGTWVQHPSYGRQLRVERFERKLPAGAAAILNYLSSGAVKGVGPATAKLFVGAFGDETLTVLEESPEKLAKLPGISRKKARELSLRFRQQSAMRRLIEFLSSHGLPAGAAMRLYHLYGDAALPLVRQNPYLLVGEEYGAAFADADAAAISLGLTADDPGRLSAALTYELLYNAENGHVFLPREKLLGAAAQLIGLEPSDLAGALERLCEHGKIVREAVAGVDACYLPALHEAEVFTAARLSGMAAAVFSPPFPLSGILEDIQRGQGIVYAPQQLQAVSLAAQRRAMLLTGGPGTGKTTSVRGILALFDALGLDTVLAAPTGRAAKRLSQVTGRDAATIHRLLETRWDEALGQLAFARDENDPLDADAVIVDETSMVDVTLMAALLRAMKPEARLVLVGDPDQLPSVGPGNVLSDLVRSGAVAGVHLTEIFRQARESTIVLNAHAVNRGECPDLKNDGGGDFFFLRRPHAADAAETIAALCAERLPKNLGIPPEAIQVLSPTRLGAAGTESLNRALQAAVNPPSEAKKERRFGPFLFREGDRVMQVKNNYDRLWQSAPGAAGTGVFNGDVGQITGIDGDEVSVDFEGRLSRYAGEDLAEIEPAFAMTVHKAQGSEYRAVILAVCRAAPPLLTRGVLYTAITRARALLILVGEESV
nr:ATP-dependent RecD-like DNA helicase [Oscillospiraceae bacterium]